MTVTIKNIKAIELALKKKVAEFKSDSSEMKKVATSVQSELRTSLREGKLDDNKSMPSIKGATVKRRERLATVNKTHKSFRAWKSNATFSGDLIQKIYAKAKGTKIQIFGKGTHKAIKGVRGKTIKGSRAAISEIIRGFSDRGVNLFYVPEKAKARIVSQFKRFLRRK